MRMRAIRNLSGSMEEEREGIHLSDSQRESSFLDKKVRLNLRIPVFNRLRVQLIVPYVLLTLILAMVGVFVITRLVTSSVQERFLNQLFEASRSVGDSFVRYEEEQLSNIRLIAYTEGMADAVQRNDSDSLQEIIWPLMLNNDIDAVAVVDLSGEGVITLTHNTADGQYILSSGEGYGYLPLVDMVLHGEIDEVGDKYIDVVATSEGDYLFTAGPIPDENGRVIGALLVGSQLEVVLSEMKSQVFSDILLFDEDGGLLAATMMIPYDQRLRLEAQAASRSDEELTDIWELRFSGRQYEIAFSPWLLRSARVGTLGIALPSNFIVTTMATSRNSFSIIFALGTVVMIYLGMRLSQSIAKPILRMRLVSQAVAAGDLEQETGVDRVDEIGELASAFDVMTRRLKERTDEAERLYAQMVERNLELAEINDRLQRTQAQLVQSEKLAAVGQLTAGIVHDVKNPLAVIKGLAEELEEEEGVNQFSRDGLKMIRSSASKANTIVTDLLKFARQSAPDMQVRDLRETMQTSLRLTEYMIRKAGVSVMTEFDEQPVTACIDPQQIEQVLVNLISNAVQAMPDGGDLTARVHANQDEIVMSIADTGVGIPDKNLARIFDPFFTTKPEEEGTGLGLSVSYGILAQHGGRIEVESTVGEGSVFTVHLKPDSGEFENNNA